jgi:hypothetical protein
MTTPKECAAESLNKKREKIGYTEEYSIYEPLYEKLNKLVPIDIDNEL